MTEQQGPVLSAMLKMNRRHFTGTSGLLINEGGLTGQGRSCWVPWSRFEASSDHRPSVSFLSVSVVLLVFSFSFKAWLHLSL